MCSGSVKCFCGVLFGPSLWVAREGASDRLRRSALPRGLDSRAARAFGEGDREVPHATPGKHECRTVMNFRAAILIASCLLLLMSISSRADERVSDAWRIGWPSVQGPTGNGVPMVGADLIDDLGQARLLWTTEDRSLGVAKTGSQTWVNAERVEQHIGPEASVFKGNWAGVVVADGRVYASSWIPAGEVFTAPYKTNRPYQKGETPNVPTRFHVEASDFVVCYDANTGKELWRTIEPGGLIRGGAKREGFQVACVVADGRVFSVGSTGRLFAHDATTGRKLWETNVGGGHAASIKLKEKSLETARAGKMVIPDEPSWFSSPVVAGGMLVVSDFAGNPDFGLRGHDPATGELKWQLPRAISRWASPTIVRLDGREYLLAATNNGLLRLIDPTTGQVQWTVDGLGKNMASLGADAGVVVLNVKPTTDKRTPGRWGAYRLFPDRAEKLWEMEDEPRNDFSTWMDNGARQQARVRGDRALIFTQGTKEVPGRVLLLESATGKVLAETPNGRDDLVKMDELVLWVGDRALVRSDHSHGASHGGRHPLVLWTVEPGNIQPVMDGGKPGGLDLIDFDSAYEVLMHVPIVDGRIFERTDDGRLACYDVRKRPGQARWDLQLPGAYAGLSEPPKLVIWTDDAGVSSAKLWYADARDVALPFGTARRSANWESCDVRDLKRDGDRITGTIILNFGTHKLPYTLDLTRNGTDVSGTWQRSIERSDQVALAGGLLGQVSATRGYPTPWLAHQPWTPFGKHPAGAQTIILGLDQAIPFRDPARGLTISLDHNGKQFTRAAATAFQYSQSWHEVDARQLTRDGNQIKGRVVVVLHVDNYLTNDTARIAEINIDATIDGEQTKGTYTARWGVGWTDTGTTTGRVSE